MTDTIQTPPAATSTWQAQPISEEVLREKYAKGEEQSILDVNRRVARALAQAEPPEHQKHWEARFLHALQHGFLPAGRIQSAAGTDLRVGLAGARIGGVWGFTTKPGTLSHWPGGLVLAFPAAGSVNGTLVLDRGDVNLTFKRYLQEPVKLVIESDHAVSVEGDGTDAELMRGYLAAWGQSAEDRAAYAVSHLGWGLNRRARWDAMTFYDKRDFNGTELRAFAGNFLYSTGANEVAGRHTLGHFDLPLRGCTVLLDGVAVVNKGVLL